MDEVDERVADVAFVLNISLNRYIRRACKGYLALLNLALMGSLGNSF